MSAHPYPVGDPRNPNAQPLLVFFEEETEPNLRASKEHGVPMFDNLVIAKVMMPGDSKSDVKYEVYRKRPDGSEKLSHQDRFGEAYEQWRKGNAPTGTGTPLTEVPWIDRATAETFKARQVYTLQQLAELSDQLIAGFPRGMHWREKARAMLAEGGKDAELTRLAEENAEMKERLSNMERMLSEQQAKAQPGARRKAAKQKETEAA